MMTLPEIILLIEKKRRRLVKAEDPAKRLRFSRELDNLIVAYYQTRANAAINLTPLKHETDCDCIAPGM